MPRTLLSFRGVMSLERIVRSEIVAISFFRACLSVITELEGDTVVILYAMDISFFLHDC